jgi:hypothetical protein
MPNLRAPRKEDKTVSISAYSLNVIAHTQRD